jgi:hypothetical protein
MENRITKMKKTSIIILVVILFSFIVLGIYYCKSYTSLKVIPVTQLSPSPRATDTFLLKTSLTPKPTVIPTRRPDPTGQVLDNGWLRFTYPEAGYSVDYPPTADLEFSETISLDYSLATFRLPGRYGLAITITTYQNKEEISLDQFVDERLEEIKNRIPSDIIGNIRKTAIVVAGHSAIASETYKNCPIVFIGSVDRFYIITLSPNMTTGNIPTEDSVDLFWKIVNTFTIL